LFHHYIPQERTSINFITFFSSEDLQKEITRD
jgi:hypothetical protein